MKYVEKLQQEQRLLLGTKMLIYGFHKRIEYCLGNGFELLSDYIVIADKIQLSEATI